MILLIKDCQRFPFFVKRLENICFYFECANLAHLKPLTHNDEITLITARDAKNIFEVKHDEEQKKYDIHCCVHQVLLFL